PGDPRPSPTGPVPLARPARQVALCAEGGPGLGTFRQADGARLASLLDDGSAARAGRTGAEPCRRRWLPLAPGPLHGALVSRPAARRGNPCRTPGPVPSLHRAGGPSTHGRKLASAYAAFRAGRRHLARHSQYANAFALRPSGSRVASHVDADP